MLHISKLAIKQIEKWYLYFKKTENIKKATKLETKDMSNESEEQNKTLKLKFIGLGPAGNNTVPTKLKSMTLFELTNH